MKGNKVLFWIITVVLVALFVYSLFFSTPTYNVTFDTNGGNTIAAVKVKRNEVVSKPKAPVKEGYTFVAWQLDGEDFDFTTPITSDVTITAKWEEVKKDKKDKKKTAKTTTTTKAAKKAAKK